MSKDKPDLKLVRELADILEEKGLSEIEVENGENRIRVSRQATAAAAPVAGPAPVPAPAALAPSSEASEEDLAKHPGAVTSPMVGTAYMAPEPGAAAFISIGDRVEKGQTLLLIEAMKTFNPVTAPKGGVVSQILVRESEPVEFGQPLVILE